MSDERIIDLVKRYPVLYDASLSQYRDSHKRNNAWAEIAEEFNTTVEEVKERWGKLRNCFTNSIKRRRKKSRPAVVNPWKYEMQMEFLLPHLETRRALRSVTSPESDNNGDDSIQDSELQLSSESKSTTCICTRNINSIAVRTTTPRSSLSPSPNHRNKNQDDVESMHKLGQKRALSTEFDENDYFFLSMSRQLNKLPRIDQAEIKFKLHKLIHEAEIDMLKKSK